MAGFLIEEIFVRRFDFLTIRAQYVAVPVRFLRLRNFRQSGEISSGGVVNANGSTPFGNGSDRLSEMNYGVRLQRNGTMTSDSACGQLDRTRNFFERLNRRVLDLSALSHNSAAFGEAELGV